MYSPVRWVHNDVKEKVGSYSFFSSEDVRVLSMNSAGKGWSLCFVHGVLDT